MKHLLILVLLVTAIAHAQNGPPPGERDGQVHRQDDGQFLAWDAVNGAWLGPDAFWSNFAARERGRNWGSGADFPRYSDVSEHDTFLYQHEAGPCLMYFFHTRWRRANDVWRWGDEFNGYGGCPTVFD